MSWSVSDERLDAALRELLTDRVDAIASEAHPMDEFVARTTQHVRPAPLFRSFGPRLRLAVVLAATLAILVAGTILVAGALRPHNVLKGSLATITGSTIYVGGATGWTQVPIRTEVRTPDYCCNFAWSPDGKRLAVWSSGGLEVVDADTGDSQLLAKSTTIYGSPAWAPDGSALALAMADQTRTPPTVRIAVLSAAGGSPRYVTPAFPILRQPSWSHDGKAIAFAGQSPDDSIQGLYLVAADGSDLHLLSRSVAPGFDLTTQAAPAWSPDDSTILVDAAACGVQCSYRIVSVRVSDGAATRLTPDAIQGVGPSWSPDGTLIAFYQWQDGPGPADLWTMRPDGSDAHRLVQGTGANVPAWTPDGRLLYDAEDTGNDVYAQLWSMKPDGSDRTLEATNGVIESVTVRPTTP